MMESILFACIITCFIIMIASLCLLWRNRMVDKYRGQLLYQMGDAIKKDFDSGEMNWRWRFEKYHEVTYYQMLYKFWKPLDSFYKDTAFLRPTQSDSK